MRQPKRPTSSVLLPLVLPLLLAGCVVPMNVRNGDLKGEKFPVETSSLDWLEIAYTPRTNDPDFPLPCRLSLLGSGEMTYYTGRSPRVWDNFSMKREDPNWNDFWEDRIHIGEESMTKLLQSFVDLGVVPPAPARMVTGDPPSPPSVKIRGKISGKTVYRVTDNRKVVRLVERQFSRFRRAP